MNKKLLIVLLVLIFPTMVYADPGGYYSEYELTFEAYVNNSEGIVIYPDSCTEEEDGKYYDDYSYDYAKYDYEYGKPSCPEELPPIGEIFIDEDGNYYTEEGGTEINKDCYENNGYPSWVSPTKKECEPELVIPYKAVVKVTELEEDEDGSYYTFVYKGKTYYTEQYNLIGTKVDLDDYSRYRVNSNLVVLGNIQLYQGPDEIFDKIDVYLKKGDKADIKFVTPNGYLYVEKGEKKGWVKESDLIGKDGFHGYYEETGTKRLYFKDHLKAYTPSLKLVKTFEGITDYYTINYIGYLSDYNKDYYVYKDSNDNIIFIDSICLGKSKYYYNDDPDAYYLYKDYMYITDNKDVFIYPFDHSKEKVKSEEILKNNEVYYILEQYDNRYYYIVVDDIGYVVDIDIEKTKIVDEMNLEQARSEYGAIPINLNSPDMLILTKDAAYFRTPFDLAQAGVINKGETIIPIQGYYNRATKNYYINVLGYGWVAIEKDMFKIKSEHEYYEIMDFDEETEADCYAYKEGKKETEYRYHSDFNPSVCYNPNYADTLPELIYSDYVYDDWGEDYDDDDVLEYPPYIVLDNIKNKNLIQKLYPLFDIELYDFYNEDNKIYKEYKSKLTKTNAKYYDFKESAKTPTVSEIKKQFEATTKKVNQENKPAVAKEVKEEKNEYTLPLIVALIVAVVVGGAITTMLIIKNKKDKKAKPVEEESKPVEPVAETPEVPEEPKEETPTEEPTPEVESTETPEEETPSEEVPEEPTEEENLEEETEAKEEE